MFGLKEKIEQINKKKLIKKIKKNNFPDSTYVGPYEKALIPLGVLEDQLLWSKKHYFKGVVLDMSTPKYWHSIIYDQPDVEKVLISDLKDEVVEKLGYKSNVDIIGDFCALEPPLPDNSIDTIYCASILEHCVSPFNMVKNLKKILRPGGIILFLTPFAYIDGHTGSFCPDYWRFCKEGYLLLANKASLKVIETGQIVDLGKYFKKEVGFNARATSWHQGVPVNNWMICQKHSGLEKNEY